MFGKKKVSLLLALFLMLLLPALALSGCSGSRGSNGAAGPAGPTGATGPAGPAGSSAAAALNGTQLIENYYCGGCHVNGQLGLITGTFAPDLSQAAAYDLANATTGETPYMDGLSNLYAQIEGAPMGGEDMIANDTNGSSLPDYVLIGDELTQLAGTYTGNNGTFISGQGLTDGNTLADNSGTALTSGDAATLDAVTTSAYVNNNPVNGQNGPTRSFYPPEVTSTLPGHGQGVALDSAASYTLPVQITFSEPVDASGATNGNCETTSDKNSVCYQGNITVSAGGTAVTGTVSIEPNFDMALIFTPSSPLAAGTTYTITVQNVGSSTASSGGMLVTPVVMSSAFTDTFTTAKTAVGDGNAIFFTANCAACHANYVDSNGNIGVMQLNGSVTKPGFDGPSLAETGFQYANAGGGSPADADYNTNALEMAVEEMYPGIIDDMINAIPAQIATDATAVKNWGSGANGNIYEQVVNGLGTANVSPSYGQVLGGTTATGENQLPALMNAGTGKYDTAAIQDVVAYLETLQDANGTGGAANGVSYNNLGFWVGHTTSHAAILSRGKSIVLDEGCEMCHSITMANCPSGSYQVPGPLAAAGSTFGGNDCWNGSAVVANTGVTTYYSIIGNESVGGSNEEGAPNLDATYDAAVLMEGGTGAGFALTGGASNNANVMAWLNHMTGYSYSGGVYTSILTPAAGQSGEGLTVLDNTATPQGSDNCGLDQTGNYASQTGTGLTEMDVVINFLRAISNETSSAANGNNPC